MEGRQLFRLTRVDTPDLRRHMARLPDRHACHPLGRLERDKPRGEVAEWLKAADCKSARASVRWFESSPLHHFPFERPRATQGSSPKLRDEDVSTRQ